jgi:DNA-binding transcriptional MerR regulator
VSKGPDAFRTISEVAEDLDLPQHVLRFWETRFNQIKPLKRGGGRRYYRPDDVDLLRGIRELLYGEGYTIKGVQRILKEQGVRFVIGAGRGELDEAGLATRIAADDDSDDDLDDFEEVGTNGSAEFGDEAGLVPRIAMQERRVASRQQPAEGGASSRLAGLSGEDIDKLEATLAELLECKRLLDQNC